MQHFWHTFATIWHTFSNIFGALLPNSSFGPLFQTFWPTFANNFGALLQRFGTLLQTFLVPFCQIVFLSHCFKHFRCTFANLLIHFCRNFLAHFCKLFGVLLAYTSQSHSDRLLDSKTWDCFQNIHKCVIDLYSPSETVKQITFISIELGWGCYLWCISILNSNQQSDLCSTYNPKRQIIIDISRELNNKCTHLMNKTSNTVVFEKPRNK